MEIDLTWPITPPVEEGDLVLIRWAARREGRQYLVTRVREDGRRGWSMDVLADPEDD